MVCDWMEERIIERKSCINSFYLFQPLIISAVLVHSSPTNEVNRTVFTHICKGNVEDIPFVRINPFHSRVWFFSWINATLFIYVRYLFRIVRFANKKLLLSLPCVQELRRLIPMQDIKNVKSFHVSICEITFQVSFRNSSRIELLSSVSSRKRKMARDPDQFNFGNFNR